MTDETLLQRQVHPGFIQAGQITSQVFRPTPKDEGLLSVYNGDLITPQASWVHYTTALQLESVGVVAITGAECRAEDLPARPDPDAFPEHAVVDFNGKNDNQIEKKSKKLKAKAVARGWLHPVQF